MSCLIPGCDRDTRSPYTGKLGMICGPHWFKLKLETRRLFWKDTDYGKRPPSREVFKAMVSDLNGKRVTN